MVDKQLTARFIAEQWPLTGVRLGTTIRQFDTRDEWRHGGLSSINAISIFMQTAIRSVRSGTRIWWH